MPKRMLPLTDLQVKTAKPKAKEYKLTDGDGLYQLITPSGRKLWRFNYRFDEKYKTLFLKSYPEITLYDARKARDDALKLLANVVEPGAVIKSQKEQIQIQSKDVNFYNLDVIISVGYRVKSQLGTLFRIWATQRLKEYIVKGFALNDERFKSGRFSMK